MEKCNISCNRSKQMLERCCNHFLENLDHPETILSSVKNETSKAICHPKYLTDFCKESVKLRRKCPMDWR